jgi:sec-independent protein translocase protein TatC
MPIGPARMPFFDHIAELRKRLFVIIIVVFSASMVAYFYALPIFDLLMRPIYAAQPGLHFIATNPFEQFTTRFQVGMYAAVVLTSPIWIWQIMAFFLPALRPKERRWFVPIFVAVLFFFLLGTAFCYFIVLTPGFHWLLTQGGSTITQLPSAGTFLAGVLLFLFAFGLGFQTPVVVFGLVYLQIVPYKKMRENWRIVYVVLMVIASIATPDWSWVTMGMLFGAMVVLYEGSMLTSRVLLAKKIAAQKAAEAAEFA